MENLQSVFNKITEFLKASTINYLHISHEATYTSEESALVRGESLETGAKAIIMKIDSNFAIFVLSASRKIDSKKIKELFSAKKTRFASTEELISLTGLIPGSIPPFGMPIFPLPLFIDKTILNQDKVAFNAGSLTNSIIIKQKDYISIANGKIIEFT